jgi:hypothetical protein
MSQNENALLFGLGWLTCQNPFAAIVDLTNSSPRIFPSNSRIFDKIVSIQPGEFIKTILN